MPRRAVTMSSMLISQCGTVQNKNKTNLHQRKVQSWILPKFIGKKVKIFLLSYIKNDKQYFPKKLAKFFLIATPTEVNDNFVNSPVDVDNEINCHFCNNGHEMAKSILAHVFFFIAIVFLLKKGPEFDLLETYNRTWRTVYHKQLKRKQSAGIDDTPTKLIK